MTAMSEFVRVSASGVLMLALCSLLQAGDVVFAASEVVGSPCEIPAVQRTEPQAIQESHVISGEVLRMDCASYLIKEISGKEVRVRTDEGTAKPQINQGDYISADVNDQNRALWIRANRGTDRRTEHASALRRNAVITKVLPPGSQ